MQQHSSLFFQSQLYVAQLCEPLSLIDFVDESIPFKIQQDSQSNSYNNTLSEISEVKPKQLQPKEKSIIVNPYKSNWANNLLNKHYKVEVTCKGNKWIIKKKQDEETSKSVVSCLPNLPKPLQNQVKLFSNTASKQTKKRLNKFILDQHRQQSTTPNEFLPGQNSSLPHLNNIQQPILKIRLNSDSPKQMPIFDINFIKNLHQFVV